MPFAVINLSNDYEVATRPATPLRTRPSPERPEAVPGVQVCVAQVLRDYSPEVTITAKAPAESALEASAD